MHHRFPNRRVSCAALAALLVLSAGPVLAHGEKTKKSDTKSPTPAAAPAKDTKAAPGSDAQHEAMMAEMMKYAAPGPEHQALNPLVGTWKTTIKTWMGAPEPQVSEGTCERNWAMGGRYLISNYKGDFGGAPFEGMEILAYDRMKKQYIGTWIDNMGTSIALSQGASMDPATRTLTMLGSMPDPTTGKDCAMREVTSLVDDNTHVFSMFATRDGKESKEMEITYTRVK